MQRLKTRQTAKSRAKISYPPLRITTSRIKRASLCFATHQILSDKTTALFDSQPTMRKCRRDLTVSYRTEQWPRPLNPPPNKSGFRPRVLPHCQPNPFRRKIDHHGGS